MPILPTPPPNGQYATISDVRDVADRAWLPYCPGYVTADGETIPLWTTADGAPLVVKIQALSLRARRDIHAKAGDDDYVFAIETCRHGIVEPAFTAAQLDILADRSAAAIDAIVKAVWTLTDLPAHLIAPAVREALGLPESAYRAPDPGQ
jgi:hypothetical protein